MNIVVLCGSYEPNPSAVGICAKNVVEALINLNHSVTVIIPYDGEHSTKSNIIRFKEPDFIKINSKKKILNIAIRLKWFFKAIIKKQNLRTQAINGYYKSLQSLSFDSNIDLIIPFSFPYETIVAAVKYKELNNPNVIIKPIIFDNFVENPLIYRLAVLKKVKRNYHLKIVTETLNSCKDLYVIHSQKNFFRDSLSQLIVKSHFIEHPLLIKPDKPLLSNGHLLYSGSFLKGYVKSKEFVELLRLILPEIESVIDFCVLGNDLHNILDLKRQYPNKIIYHGRVPKIKADEIIRNSSILISVSEISGIQISSKIFNYMSTGKPILQLYYNDDDANVKILSKYPLAYFFKLDFNFNYSEKTIQDLIFFLKNNMYVSIDPEEILKIYPEAVPLKLAEHLIKNESL